VKHPKFTGKRFDAKQASLRPLRQALQDARDALTDASADGLTGAPLKAKKDAVKAARMALESAQQ
jgi:hypothetical protein